MRKYLLLLVASLVVAGLPAAAEHKAPSRPAEKGCAWETVSDAALGFEAWVQRCDFGFRKIDFLVVQNSLSLRYSDGGAPDPLVDVLDLQPDETPAAGIKRLFAARTDAKLAKRCILQAYKGEPKAPAGVKRYTFVPDAAFQKELDAQREPDGVPDPPCGDWGDAPDGIQYFEAQPASGAHKVLFVRVGQDTPLFDAATLRLLAPKPAEFKN